MNSDGVTSPTEAGYRLTSPEVRYNVTSPTEVTRNRYPSLPRPSDMPSANNHPYKYTGQDWKLFSLLGSFSIV